MRVTELTESNEKWIRFLKEKKHLVFHRPEWKQFIEDSFGISMKYFAVEEDDKIRMIFPMGIIDSLLFGKRLISVPYLEYGGFAGESRYVQFLIEHVKQLYSSYDYIQVREGVPENYLVNNGFKKVEEASRFILNLDAEEKIWGSIDKQKRKAVRKAEEMGVEVRDIGYNEVSNVYRLYSHDMKKFGVPAFPIKYFDNLWVYMIQNGLGKALGAYIDGTLIAALLGFTYKDRVHITISVSKKGYLDYRPNDILHWEFIKWAIQEGYKIFDFGHVKKGTGHFDFKEKWNTELKPLNNYYLFLNKKEVTNLDKDSKKYKFLRSVWRKTPSFVLNKIGPKIRERIGY